MPIRLNLLAEAQDAEEMRRRDPVKRAVWIGGFLVFLLLLYSSTLQFEIMAKKSELKRHEVEWKGMEKDYANTSAKSRTTAEIKEKLLALDRLATNRFVWAAPLNALQQTVVENVQVVRLRGEHGHAMMEAVPPRTNMIAGKPRVIAGKPANITEKITMVIEARDYGITADQTYNKFESAINSFPYFKERLKKTTLSNFSAPTPDPKTGSNFVLFTLECLFPEVTRE